MQKVTQCPTKRSSSQTTAFTSIVVGVFLNSPNIPLEYLKGINEDEIYRKYGHPFLTSLQRYSDLHTLEQLQILHILQRYFIIHFTYFVSKH